MTSARNTYRNRQDLPEIPKHQKRAPRHKRYGIEQWSNWSKKWHCWQWYATKKARDQAFKNLSTKTTILRGTKWDTPMRKLDR